MAEQNEAMADEPVNKNAADSAAANCDLGAAVASSAAQSVLPTSASPAPARDFVRHARTVAGLTAVSRVVGMVRDMVLAAAFGTQAAMDAFTVAFAIPNLFRRLFSEGALSVAFIPVYTSALQRGEEAAAQRLANVVLTLLVMALAALVLTGEAVIGLIYMLGDPSPRLTLTLQLAAVMLPFVLSICLVGLLQAILNVRDHFVMPALAPIVLNLSIIAAAGAGAYVWGDGVRQQIFLVAVAVLLAGVVQVAMQAVVLRRHGLRFRPMLDMANPHLRRVLTLMLPMIVALGIVQLNTLLDQVIAMGLSAYENEAGQLVTSFAAPGGRMIDYPMDRGAVSVLYYSQRLYQLPFGIFTIALGTAIFPALARSAHQHDRRQIAATLNRGLRLATFISLPCMVGLIVVAAPLVQALFERGQFNPADTPRVVAVTSAYALGLVIFSVLHLVTRAFFAMQETRLPMKVSMWAAGMNLLLNLTLIWWLGVAGLAISTVTSAGGQAALLLWLLRRRVGRLGLRSYMATFLRSAAASGVMAGTVIGMLHFSHGWLGTAESWQTALMHLMPAVVVGALAYFACVKLLRMPELSELLQRSRNRPVDA